MGNWAGAAGHTSGHHAPPAGGWRRTDGPPLLRFYQQIQWANAFWPPHRFEAEQKLRSWEQIKQGGKGESELPSRAVCRLLSGRESNAATTSAYLMATRFHRSRIHSTQGVHAGRGCHSQRPGSARRGFQVWETSGAGADQLWGCPNTLDYFPLARPTKLRHWVFSNSQSHGCTPFCFRGPGLCLIRHHS